MWTFRVYDTLTGDLVAPLVLATNGMGRAFNAGRSGSSTWVAPLELTRDQIRSITAPWSRVLVKFWDGVPKFAHLVVAREWDEDRGVMTLAHSDIWAILSKRTTFGTDGYGNTEFSRLTMNNFTLAAMIPWIVWAGTEGPTANFTLPIWLPEGKLTYALINSLPHAGPHSRTIWDYEIQFLDEAISEIVETEGGPDVDFVPQIVDSKFRWLLRVGVITAGSSDWALNAPVRGLTGVLFKEDGLTLANVNYAIGVGSERDMLVRTARAEPAGVPALERAETYKAIEDGAQLQAHANSDLGLRALPTRQMSASMVANVGPTVGGVEPGHQMRLYFQGHRFELDGWQTQRVIALDTDLTHSVRVELQEVV